MKKQLLAFALSAMTGLAVAGSEEDAVRAAIQARFPNTQITSVAKSQIAGLFEVVTGRNVSYTDPTGRYMVFGSIFDTQTQADLTQARRQELMKVDWANLPLNKAVKVVRGNGSRVFAVFSDPDCPYCRKLEQELAKVDNYTMYLFLYPLPSLHPDAGAKAEAIWCAASKDQAQQWWAMMRENKEPAKKSCPNPLPDVLKFAQENGIMGTPTMIRKDGAMMSGALPADRLEQWLDNK